MNFFKPFRERLAVGETVTLDIRVRPQAKQTRITASMDDGSLKVELAAPADRGKANEALVHFLAHALGVPVACVALVRGHGSRRKTVRVSPGTRLS